MVNSASVSAELGLSLVVADHGLVPLMASMYYSAKDPFAIRMAFHVGTDEPVEWIFSRDLLASGLEGPTGAGDVQIWPAVQDGGEVFNIALCSPFGQALFEAPIAATADFLKRTFEVIPVGQESEAINLDSELEELLWSA